MDKSYKRIDNIDAKIQDVKLSYAGWRTLFLIDEETQVSQISEILSEEPLTVEAEIKQLLEAELIKEMEAAAEEAEPVEETTETAEVPEEQVEDLLPKKTEETVPEPEPEEVVEEEPIEEQLAEISESEQVVAELPDESIDIVEEPQAEEPIPEEAALPEEIAPTEEDLEINIHDENASEADMLDVDFAEDEKEKEVQPAQEEATAPAPIPEPSDTPAPSASGTPSVLVIDDSIVIRKMVEIALENEELTIYTAVSGKDGLDKIDQLNPSLVILDLMLPDINGIDILKTLKASRNIPVIMLSGKDSPQMVEKAKEAGADTFLPKPFKDDELKDQIKVLLEAQS